ncbi:ROK family transcriptional regulator [Nocardioides luteus]|uniref:Sugar kinase n=1 Tax=Nocardioides luteus TaxID=1844 RepID=A0A1J4MX71_9ACTN|nr:ROK family transcriptional regulator [Nocardioides luteus]OIJ23942.1 sugar kinase [Nocardioides luteus]
MSRAPKTHLIRDTNDRAALDLMLSNGPITKTRLGELVGLSKVTAGQLLTRLGDRGLVEVVGAQQGGRGPNAALYGVVPSAGYVAALHIGPDQITASVADITGTELATGELDPHEASDPVEAVRATVAHATRSAGITMEQLRCLSIGTPGMIDPRTGDIRFANDLPDWRAGVLEDLRRSFQRPILIENDVNLAGLAEQSAGASHGVKDSVLAWIDRGLGLAVIVDGRLHRGAGGGAGEIGYLAVPGASTPHGTDSPQHAAFQSLVSVEAMDTLARAFGLSGSGVDCVRAAVEGDADAEPFLEELARRLALGLAGICVVLDPELCVLAGEVGRAGGEVLAARVQKAIASLGPNVPTVVPTAISGDPVLRGALQMGLDTARDEVFAHQG